MDSYLEYRRRALVLSLLEEHVGRGAKVCDVGAQPFILSAMTKLAGYDVTAIDVEPERYARVAEAYSIKTLKADLERDPISLPDGHCDAAVFSEVLEHLNPYYVPHALAEINRVLRMHGVLILTTPNVASLFRRLRLLAGGNPIYHQ